MNRTPVDVNELLERIRAEADRRARAGINTQIETGAESLPLPPTKPQAHQPTLHISDLEIANTAQKLDRLLDRAAGANAVSRWIPKPLRGLWRQQGQLNESIIAALQGLLKSELRGLRSSQNVTAYLDAQWHWSHDATERVELLYTWLSAIPIILNEAQRKFSSIQRDLEDVRRKVEEVRSDLTATSIAGIGFEEMVRSAAAGRDAIARLSEQLELIQDRETSSQAEIRDLREEATKLHNAFHDSMVVNAELRRDFQILNTSYGATEAQVRGMREWLETLQRDLQSTVVDAELRRDFQILNTGYAATEAQVRGMQEWLEKIQQTLSDRTLPPALQEDLNEIGRMKQSLEQISNRTETLDERVVADGAFLKAQFALQQRQLDSLVSGRTGNGTTAQRTPKKELPADLVDHTYDAFYLAFEDRFRGTRAQIMKRMKVYLPFLKGSGWTKKGTRILDLGCGRGEWLELLRSSGYDKSQGVDLNSAMIQYCRERKLNVAEANALTFLAGAKTASFHAVTAYHLIEHLEFSALLNLASEAQRVLKPGGLVIFETPNPRNILVGASDFYRDMTHRNPIHPDTISFALETLGFTQVQVYFLADEKESRQAVPQEEFRFDDLAAYVDVPRDYAVVARTA